jgi:hypothetical protein
VYSQLKPGTSEKRPEEQKHRKNAVEREGLTRHELGTGDRFKRVASLAEKLRDRLEAHRLRGVLMITSATQIETLSQKQITSSRNKMTNKSTGGIILLCHAVCEEVRTCRWKRLP